MPKVNIRSYQAPQRMEAGNLEVNINFPKDISNEDYTKIILAVKSIESVFNKYDKEHESNGV